MASHLRTRFMLDDIRRHTQRMEQKVNAARGWIPNRLIDAVETLNETAEALTGDKQIVAICTELDARMLDDEERVLYAREMNRRIDLFVQAKNVIAWIETSREYKLIVATKES